MRPSRFSSTRWRTGLAAVVTLATSCAGGTQSTSSLPADALRTLQTIRGKDIIGHARVLSDPVYHGREAGTKGVRHAASYISAQFRQARLSPGGNAGSYFQSFKIRAGYSIAAELGVAIGDTLIGELKRNEDYAVVHVPGGKAEVSTECLLVGYGITAPALGFDEYAGIDVRGKAVIVFSGTPWPLNAAQPLPAKAGTLAYKVRNAAEHGAVCVLVVADPAGWRKALGAAERLRVPDASLLPGGVIPVVQITRDLAARITSLSRDELRQLARDVERDRAPQSMPLRGRRLHLVASITGKAQVGRNIVGILAGRDPALKREAVVIGAHYDHLGEGSKVIFFGANDNAAGVGTLLSITRAFAALPERPKRSIVFLAFDAEEIGRLGSKHYVSRPCIPIAQTTLMINFDVIGRNEPDHISAVGTRSSPQLHQVHQEMNQHVGLRVSHPASFRLGRSDHSPFYYAGVPIMYLFGGLDPDYNTPRDTWDKLIPGKVEKVGRLAFLTALAVANRDDRLTFVPGQDHDFLRELMRGLPTP